MFGLSIYGEFCYDIEPLFGNDISGSEVYFCEGLERYTEHKFVDSLKKIYLLEE